MDGEKTMSSFTEKFRKLNTKNREFVITVLHALLFAQSVERITRGQSA